MRKSFYLFAFLFFAFTQSANALSWWLQPTVCRIDTSKCYASMFGAGYDTEMWDASARCRGMKMICGDALRTPTDGAIAMGKSDIESKVNPDYNANVLNGDCFGARRTTNDGGNAIYDGGTVKIWCAGILNNPDETVAGGEITYGAQPTCDDLANDGWVAVKNGNCYGKYYDPARFYIECGANELPTRIIELNGANAQIGGGASNSPADLSAANSLFNSMQNVSETKKQEHF